jgi:hypothetical protein
MTENVTKDVLLPLSPWGQRIIYAMIISFCTVGLFMVIALGFRTVFDQPPIMITSLNESPLVPVCPGVEIPIRNHVIVKRPTILLMYISVTDIGENYNLNNTGRILEPRLHPHESEFDHEIPWTVPELSPGSYARVLAIRGHNPEEDPVFVDMFFTIGKGCRK